jgi:hypothetical protein
VVGCRDLARGVRENKVGLARGAQSNAATHGVFLASVPGVGVGLVECDGSQKTLALRHQSIAVVHPDCVLAKIPTLHDYPCAVPVAQDVARAVLYGHHIP